MKYYSAIKRNRILTDGTAWMNLKCITLSERSQTQKATYCKIPFIQHSCKGKTIQTDNRSWLLGVFISEDYCNTKYHRLGGLKQQKLVL